jgi:CxxC motif-containing protein (DUF1111 family)
MAKSQLAYGVSLTAVAVMFLAGTAAAQSAHHDRGHGGHSGTGTTTTTTTSSATTAVDPGVRGGTAGAGDPVPGLTPAQQLFFTAAQARFEVVETVAAGLGPGFNELSCAGCHIAPAVGGASPAVNPQVTDANTDGATNVIPSFVTANGPIREARFVLNADGTPDGGVHDLFSIQGRADAPGCVFAQPNFAAQLAANNVIFRIPINTFGDGLIEGTSDTTLQNAVAAQATQNASLGISGQFNLSGNTGNITRFGWKAQNASMLMFAGEAYNVEEGVTNQLFPDKRNPTASPQCTPNALPEDTVNTVDTINSVSTVSDNNPDITNFALYMSLLAPPTPVVPITDLMAGTGTASTASTTSTTASSTTSTSASSTMASTVQMASVLPVAASSSTTSTTSTTSSTTATPSVTSLSGGLQAFLNVGCGGCHLMNLTTGNLALIDTTTNPNISNLPIHPFSDYAVHNMGTGLADGVSQGNANGNQFKTTALWGVGQRNFLLHDGRTSDLMSAILQHSSSGSEANAVIAQFQLLSVTDQQNILNFLRSL